MKNALMRAHKCAFLNGGVVDDVNAIHVHMRIGEGAEPAAVELNAGRLSWPRTSPGASKTTSSARIFTKASMS
jgi:hypothetical protein